MKRWRHLWLAVLASVFGVSAPAGETLPGDATIAEAIDHFVNARLAAEQVEPAPAADEAVLIRRTSLDLVGRPATLAEVDAYLAADGDKRRELIDRLIDSPEFVPHQARSLDVQLMFGSGRSLQEYLQPAVAENRPWDRVFRELMLPESAAASQFLRARVGDLDKLTNEASVVFFGVNVSCAKCHDHPLVGDWTQDRFYGMKSFFNRTFENGDFIGERDYGYVDYKTHDGEQHRASLMFFDGTQLDEPEAPEPDDKQKKAEKQRLEELKKKKQPPPPAKFSRRAQLVEVALREDTRHYLARALVNQLWARFYGRGLVHPVDQMHPENPASHPDLLEWLTQDLVAHQFDVRRLVRGLVSSDAYARSSRWDGDDRPATEWYAVAEVRPLTPHQYGAVLRMASTNPAEFAADRDDLPQRLERLHNAADGLAGLFEQPRESFQVSVEEALQLSNGDRAEKDLLRVGGDSLARLQEIDNPDERARFAWRAVYGRTPTDSQIAPLAQYLGDRGDRPQEAVRQVVWALLCSSPCRFNY